MPVVTLGHLGPMSIGPLQSDSSLLVSFDTLRNPTILFLFLIYVVICNIWMNSTVEHPGPLLIWHPEARRPANCKYAYLGITSDFPGILGFEMLTMTRFRGHNAES